MLKVLNPKVLGLSSQVLLDYLRDNVIGQDAAMEDIVKVFQVFNAGFSQPGRPLSNMLLLGPTGTGKTHTAEMLAKYFFGTTEAVIKIDCAEFAHSHDIAKLIGSPPGYLGHRETHPLLSKEVLEKNYTENTKISLVLFDEIEKSSDTMWNLLLGILDKGILTLGDNRRVDFSRSMIFMTSNLGARQMADYMENPLGFTQAPELDASATDIKLEKIAREAARRKFTPEFMNRIDRTLVYHSLTHQDLNRVLDLELANVSIRTLGGVRPFAFVLSDSTREFILKEGFDARYGARHLKRAIDKHLVPAFSNLVATAQVSPGDVLRVDYDGDLIFLLEQEGLSLEDLTAISAEGSAVKQHAEAA